MRQLRRINELKQTLAPERTEADKAEIYILEVTEEKKQALVEAKDALLLIRDHVKTEQKVVEILISKTIPELKAEYNKALSTHRATDALRKRITQAEQDYKFKMGWLHATDKKHPDGRPIKVPSDSDKALSDAESIVAKAESVYRFAIQSAFAEWAKNLSERADAAMKVLFEVFEDKERIIGRVRQLVSHFQPLNPNSVQVSGFIATFYRDTDKKIRYQKMCSIFPAAVLAGKHVFEDMVRADKEEAQEKHDREYEGHMKAYISNAVRVFETNNPDADFRSEQWQETIKKFEVEKKAQYLTEHPKKPFVYDPPKYEPLDPIPLRKTIWSMQEDIAKASAAMKAQNKIDIANGKAVPQIRSHSLFPKLSGKPKVKKPFKIPKEKKGDPDMAEGFTQADMMNTPESARTK